MVGIRLSRYRSRNQTRLKGGSAACEAGVAIGAALAGVGATYAALGFCVNHKYISWHSLAPRLVGDSRLFADESPSYDL